MSKPQKLDDLPREISPPFVVHRMTRVVEKDGLARSRCHHFRGALCRRAYVIERNAVLETASEKHRLLIAEEQRPLSCRIDILVTKEQLLAAEPPMPRKEMRIVGFLPIEPRARDRRLFARVIVAGPGVRLGHRNDQRQDRFVPSAEEFCPVAGRRRIAGAIGAVPCGTRPDVL